MGTKKVTVEVSCNAPNCYSMISEHAKMSISSIPGNTTARFIILMRNESAEEEGKPLPFKCPTCANTDPDKMKIRELS